MIDTLMSTFTCGIWVSLHMLFLCLYSELTIPSQVLMGYPQANMARYIDQHIEFAS